MVKRVIAALAIIMVLFLCAVWPQFDHYARTGRFSPIKKIESLQSPTAVKGWTEAGLLLDGGRTIQLPGFRSLPALSDALTEVVQRGVEVATNGRIFGLVKVHHWCGNDPVREHIAKVDISDMLLFLGSASRSIQSLELIWQNTWRGRRVVDFPNMAGMSVSTINLPRGSI